ncbi:MAG: hypothetical protein WC385_01715 [Candidatus Paceibacterota bacterium]|jgi:phosphoribosylaminoimidazole (AIR) synthetase
MNPEQLFNHVKGWATKVNGIASIYLMGMGFAIPIPEEATDEAKTFVDSELAKLAWDFNRCTIGPKEYYVLFPL